MKYAKKMILIPEEEYKELLELKNKSQEKIGEIKTKYRGKVGEIKTKVKKILKEKPTHNAAKRMSQLVGEYLRYKQSEHKPKKKKLDLLQYFTPLYHEKVKVLMSTLESRGISLTDKNELILSSGQVVANSNIIDLLKEALVVTKRKQRAAVPIGWAEFIQEIVDLNLPLKLFTKRSTLDDIHHLSREQQWVNL